MNQFNDTRCRAVLESVFTERMLQQAKWGLKTHSPEKWMIILGEEFGEVCKEILERTSIHNLRKELIQVAAVAVAIVEQLDRR